MNGATKPSQNSGNKPLTGGPKNVPYLPATKGSVPKGGKYTPKKPR